MAREHLVIDLQNGVEWMRCSAGQVWNGSSCEGAALKLSHEDVSKQLSSPTISWVQVGDYQLGLSLRGWFVRNALQLR